MCVDYRTLNHRTIPDQYTVPCIDDALDCLSGTFQRLMEKAVGDMHMHKVIVYLDDLIVFGKTLEEHEQRLLKVITRLEEAGLKLSLDKCQFCRLQVTYVGHIVSERGIATDPAKVEAVTKWEQPTDLPALQSFLGFFGYYRRFIQNYSIIVRPLTVQRVSPPLKKKESPVLRQTRPTTKSESPLVTGGTSLAWRLSKRSSAASQTLLCWHSLTRPNPTYFTLMQVFMVWVLFSTKSIQKA